MSHRGTGDARGAAGPPADTNSGAGESLGLDSLGSRSWAATTDAEIQRDLIAGRVFEDAPLTIDRFEVEKLVGAGSTATVYAARDPLLDRRVAIKVLARPRPDRLAAATERLIREARALAHLSHRNVVVIHEVGQWKDRPFIAMELIEGTTLAQWLAAERRPVGEILAVFREAGQGLAAAHARGHVHRDFKPANVLVAYDGRVVVSDFGLADDATDHTPHTPHTPESRSAAAGDPGVGASGTPRRRAVGTPAYVAPEQRAGAAAHPTADVYSFALALIEAVLGYHPLPATLATLAMPAMPAQSGRWKSALRGRVSRQLHRRLCSAMEPDPLRRAQSLGPLLEALAARPRRGRRVAGALAIGSAAVGMAIALTWRRAPSKPPEPRPVALLPSEIFHVATELLAVPADHRDESWSERTRSLLMLPVPARVPCRWPATQRAVMFAGDNVVMLDLQDRVTSCEISTGTVTTVASDVTCIRAGDDDTVLGVAFHDGRIALYQRRGASWSERARPSSTLYAAGARPNPACNFVVSSQGIVPPLLSLRGDQLVSDADLAAFAGGGRKIVMKADSSLVSYADDAPPRPLLAAPVDRVRFDDALHVGVTISPGHVRIFDASTGSAIAEVPVGSGRLDHSSIDISRDGAAAVAVWLDGPLLWWRRGEPRWHRRWIANSSTEVHISPRGDRALTWDYMGQLDVYELASGRRYPLADAQIRTAHFVDTDHVVAVDSAGAVWQWSLTQMRSSVLADHREGRMWGFAACDHDGSIVTATNGKDAAIALSSPSGAPQIELTKPADAQIYGIACHGDRILAGTLDGHVLEWEWPSGRRLADHDVGVASWVWTIATAQPASGPRVDFFGTGKVKTEPRSGGRVVALRDGVVTPIFTTKRGGNTGIDDIAVSSDGRRTASAASSGQLTITDVATGTMGPQVTAHHDEARRVRFTDADRSVMTAGDDGYLRTWSADDLALHGELNLGHGPIYDLDLRGTVALAATSDGHVGAWDVAGRRMIRGYAGHTALVGTARFDASGRWIASGDFDGRLCVHRADRERCYIELSGHDQTPIRHVRFLDNGQLITASDDGTVRQWRLPYDASSTELACELQTRVADPEWIDCAAR